RFRWHRKGKEETMKMKDSKTDCFRPNHRFKWPLAFNEQIGRLQISVPTVTTVVGRLSHRIESGVNRHRAKRLWRFRFNVAISVNRWLALLYFTLLELVQRQK